MPEIPDTWETKTGRIEASPGKKLAILISTKQARHGGTPVIPAPQKA
jgi:hypothetical protein